MKVQSIISLTASAALFFSQAAVVMSQPPPMTEEANVNETGQNVNESEEGAVLGMPPQMPGKFGGPLGPYQSPMGQMPIPPQPGMPPMPFPPQPGMPIQPFGGGLIPVSVQGDATYLVPGPVCSGSGIAPAGFQCPHAGMQAVADCHPNIPSNNGSGMCVLPANTVCVRVNFDTWGCAFENGMGRVPGGLPMQQLPPGGLPMQQLPLGRPPMQQMPLGSQTQQLPPGGLPMQQLPLGRPPMQQMPLGSQMQQMPPLGGLPRPQMPIGLPMAQTQQMLPQTQRFGP